MNQVDKEYMQSKGFLDENERAVDARLQEAALSEAAMFAGSVLAAGHDLEHLQMVTSYMEELAGKKHFLHIHLFAQRTYGDCRSRGELDDFYAASLQDDALFVYAAYFVVYLGNFVRDLDLMRTKIRGGRAQDKPATNTKEKIFIPSGQNYRQKNGGRVYG